MDTETRMDQSNRYADLSLTEKELIEGGKHILVAYKMKPKTGYDLSLIHIFFRSAIDTS